MGHVVRQPKKVAILLLVCCHTFISASSQSCTFTLEDGTTLTFNNGESIHSYRPNRCINSESFPCYCNPEAPGQIECPYCWVPSNSGNLICINDGASITYNNIQGSLETCGCSVSATEFNSFSTDCRPAQSRQDNNKQTGGNNGSGGGSDPSSGSCIVNGQFFDRGQTLGFAYDSGCAGPSFDFQCVCNPDLPSQIECPFCYFDIMGNEEPICTRDGEVVTIQDVGGRTRTCGCTVPEGGSPQSDCFLPADQANTCAIALPDGSYQTFASGESLQREKPSRCGADHPCYCDPSIRGQIWCPYCAFAESTEALICARDGETITYNNIRTGDQERCSCEVPTDTSQPPISSCSKIFNAPNIPADDSGGGDGDDDNDSGGSGNGNPSSELESWRVCQLEGKLYFEGENLGDSFRTRCGSSRDFPCYCNPDRDPPVHCPYCGFALSPGSLLCLKDQEVASFANIDGDELTCECNAPIATRQPSENCLVPASDVNTCVFQSEDGGVFTYQEGDPVDDSVLPLSFCGPQFPCLCDPALENQLYCPYCVRVDFGGQLICAAEGEIAFFEDENGQTQQCFCEVPEDRSLGEPSLNCDGDPPRAADSPTSQPAPVPTPTPTPSGDVCSVKAPTGETVNIADGNSFGDLIGDGVCGDAEEWPAFCNADSESSTTRQINDQVVYPYCIFDNTLSGETVCARDNGRVNFVDDTGAAVVCTCVYDVPQRTSCFPANGDNGSSGDGIGNGGSSGAIQWCMELHIAVGFALGIILLN